MDTEHLHTDIESKTGKWFVKREETSQGILARVSAMQRFARITAARVIRWGLGTVRLSHP